MLTYTIRRLCLAVPTLLFIALVIFMLLELAPGDPTAQIPLTVPPEVKAQMREALGLKQFSLKAKKAEKLHSKLDDLEEQVADLKADAEGVDDKVKARVERLSEEIAAVGGKAKKTKKTKKVKAKKPAAKAKAKAKVAAAPKADENGRLSKPIGSADDLKLIKGVGAVLERRLNDAGIFHFWQIAKLRKAQMDMLEGSLRFPGRMTRDNWKAQARALAKTVTG